MVQPFPLVIVEGTAFERGRQHGAQAAERIAVAIETHRRAIKHFSGLDWEGAVRRAAAYEAVLRQRAPEMLEELRGIAEGAGIAFADVLTLNVRAEMSFTPRMAEGCTSFALLPEATADGHTYLGQNWDNLAPLVDACIVLKAMEAGRPRYVTVAEAGVPAMVGLNAAGIGIVRNALIARCDNSEVGLPMNAVHYQALWSEVIADAVGAVTAGRLATPWFYLIAAVGDAIGLEAAPPRYDLVHDRGGVLTHANHYLSSRLGVQDVGPSVIPDSLFRDHRLHRFLESKRGLLDVPTIFTFMRDHFSYPDSICRHADERDPADGRMATVFSVVMDLDARTLYLSDGQPCQNGYRAIAL